VTGPAAPGELVLDHATRRFSVRGDRGRTIKEVVLRRAGGGPPPTVALDDVTLRIGAGETVGVVGRNGAGKSSTLRVLAGIVPLDEGSCEVGGRIVSLLELSAGFGREFSGRENVYLNGALHGLGREEIEARLDRILAFAELGEFIDAPVKTYSSGMLVRLGFSIAAHLDADVLLIDEVLAVGDEAFQRKCFGKIFEFKQAGGTIVFVSHDASSVERLCDRAILLKDGAVSFDGPTHEAIVAYRSQLAGERNPEERAAGLKEWGGDVARVEHVRLLGPDGDERMQLLSGEPFSIALDVVAESSLAPPRLGWELRDDAAILVAAGAVSTAELGWDAGTRTLPLRFDAERPPFADGRLHLRVDLTDERTELQHHSVDDAIVFVVYPSDDGRGLIRLEGRWAPAAELERL